ncbi:MAG TPA: hypothetical protein DHV36_10385 [Desulfobacteraceae bacterium]|nr:hypothetical protein [Desulfobacteraceae bacterium]
MKKHVSNARLILNALGNMTEFLKNQDTGDPDTLDPDECFNYPLEIIRQTLLFDISVLYKVSNVIEDMLILEVVRVLDPDGHRMDLKEGRKLRLYLDARDRRYVNEVNAFSTKRTSHINVSGMGCDIMGYVYFPRDFGGAYLVGGDYFGKDTGLHDFEISAMDIMCNMLSAILLKTRFKEKAEIDDLTGLANSGKIRHETERILKRFRRKPSSCACIAMGDIDFFKKVNDTYGHIQGDLVLKEVAAIISESLREYFDIAGRYGGEEFLLVFDETDGKRTMEIVERIRKTIEAHRFQQLSDTGRPVKDKYIQVTMSFGVAEMTGKSPACDPQDWIGKADKALYDSKQSGRNRTTFYQDSSAQGEDAPK